MFMLESRDRGNSIRNRNTNKIHLHTGAELLHRKEPGLRQARGWGNLHLFLLTVDRQAPGSPPHA